MFTKCGALLDQKGFTLVELMAAMVMSSIILISIFVIVSGSHEYMLKGRDKTNLQQDFSLIEYVLSRNISAAMSGEEEIYASYADYLASAPTQSSGGCLRLTFPSGDSTVFYKDSNHFKIEATDLSITKLVADVVSILVFTEGSQSITTDIMLRKGTQSITSTFVHAFKNITGPEILRPMGTGASAENNETGCSSHWQCVDEATADGDLSYVRGGNSTSWKSDSYATEDGSGTGTIDSVAIYVQTKTWSSSPKARTVVRLAGTNYFGAEIDLTAVSSYTDFFTSYATNPNTAAAWTWAEVDAMEIGVSFQNNGRCTQVWAQLYTTE